jgi:L-ascorbate metabolism protein UlaG (beta-lactamase superfamily)
MRDIKWLGHASFKIGGEKVVYIDPWKLEGKNEKADIILITHDHYDHCSLADIEKLRGSKTTVIAPPDAAKKITGDVREVKSGRDLTVKGIKIETYPAYNLEKSFHPRANGWLGYVITINGKRIYHTGDTDLIPEMDKIRADVVLLPVGGTYTMDAKQAAQAANRIKPKLAIPMHFGSIVGSSKDAEEFRSLCQVPVEILERS